MLSVTGDYQNINKANFTAIFKESFERSTSQATKKMGSEKQIFTLPVLSQ